ncbi:MAG: 16S rRNA processing protein RimM [Acidobacteria bacterium]|nr:16S rRNA processing protein RimM [Acidobacteriota bacterium]
MTSNTEFVSIGRVVKPHGIRGELVIEVYGDTLSGLEENAALHVGGESHSLVGSRPHQGRLLVRLEKVVDRTAAESLRGAELTVEREALAALEASEWYADDLVGWSVLAEGASIGRVAAVLAGSPHDYIVLDDQSQTLIPMVREWLVDIDHESRVLGLELPDGLMEHPASTADTVGGGD